MTAVMPAQVRRPKQKASAGGTVRDAATRATAQLGNGAFATIEDARTAVQRCPGACNAHPFQKREGSCDSAFAEAEATELKPLPDVRHDVCERVCNRPVGPDFHVVYAKNRHFAPPTAASGGRRTCAWASRHCQSTTPASASPRTRSSPPT